MVHAPTPFTRPLSNYLVVSWYYKNRLSYVRVCGIVGGITSESGNLIGGEKFHKGTSDRYFSRKLVCTIIHIRVQPYLTCNS